MKKHFFVSLCLLALCGCTPSQTKTSDNCTTNTDSNSPICLTSEQLSRIKLTTTVAQIKSLPIDLSLVGSIQVNPNLTTPVVSLVPGRLEDVKVLQGDYVQKGQVLGNIRSDEVGQIESDVLTKMMELEVENKEAQVKLTYAQKVYDRRNILLEEKIAARAEVEQAETDLQQAQVMLTSLKEREKSIIKSFHERLLLFGLPDKEIHRLLDTRTVQHVFSITSPRAGIVTSREADPGEIIESGKPLFQITDLSKVWLVAQVFEKDIKAIRKGLLVTLVVEGFPNEKFTGVIDFVDSCINPQTRTLAIRATINNPKTTLKPDMFANVTVQTGTTTHLVIPTKCVQQIGEASLVYVALSNNSFQERKIMPGPILGNYMEVVSGLKPGEVVVEDGSLKLAGQSIQRFSQ